MILTRKEAWFQAKRDRQPYVGLVLLRNDDVVLARVGVRNGFKIITTEKAA